MDHVGDLLKGVIIKWVNTKISHEKSFGREARLEELREVRFRVRETLSHGRVVSKERSQR